MSLPQQPIKTLLWLLVFINFVIVSHSHANWLKAGYAQIDISPKIGATIQVMTGEQKTIDSINDPLLAKAIFLTDGTTQTVLLSLDLIGLNAIRQEDLTAQVKAASGIEKLILAVTHTHSGILPPQDQLNLTPRLVSLIKTAKQNLKQVNMQVASSQFNHGYKRIINNDGKGQMLWTNQQRLPTEFADLTLGVINLTTKDNKPFITLVNYNAHPVITMNRQEAIISADYPARLAHHLKQQYGANTLFMLGAAGDINPFDAGISDMGVKPLKAALDSADKLGKALANKVIAMVNNSTTMQNTMPLEFKTANIKLQYSGLQQKVMHIIKNGLNDSHLTHQINILTLGNQLALASFGGEFFSDFKVQLQQQSPFKHTFFIGYANGNIGYIPTQQALKLGGYGANKDSLIYQSNTGDKLIDKAINMLRK